MYDAAQLVADGLGLAGARPDAPEGLAERPPEPDIDPEMAERRAVEQSC